jgi:hypothetical protein
MPRLCPGGGRFLPSNTCVDMKHIDAHSAA